jgi:transcription elongation GreA/GreB family factor
MSVAWGLLSTSRNNDRIIEAARKSVRADVVAVASRSSVRMGATVELEPASWGVR